MTTQKTLAEFIRENKLSLRAEYADSNPNMDDSANMDHWKCTLRNGRHRRTMTLYFSKGYGHHGSEPECDEVLECLASDSSSVDQSFEDWASDLGYDTDSRKAERTYKVCRKQADKLKALLGESAYEELLYSVERL